MTTKLRAYRRDRKLSQRALARLVGCDQGTISHYETGYSFPQKRHRDRLELALGQPLDVLLQPETKTTAARTRTTAAVTRSTPATGATTATRSAS